MGIRSDRAIWEAESEGLELIDPTIAICSTSKLLPGLTMRPSFIAIPNWDSICG